MNRFSLICAASLSLCALSQAQPILPPDVQRGAPEPAPLIDEKAEQFVDQMVARYAALKSYSDVTQLRLENAAGEPVNVGAMAGMNFRATLQWERPARIRFEGKNAKGAFLALGTDEIMRVVSPDHPGNYVARPRNPPMVITHDDGTKTEMPNPSPIRLEEPLFGYGISGWPGSGFMLDAGFWKRTQKDVSALNFDPDAQVEGESCRVVRIQFLGNDGHTSVSRAFVAKSDGLLRRYENRFDRMPADTFIAETHSDVRANPDLPAATWDFEPPSGAKPLDSFFQLDEGKYDPDIKLGELLPTFSADALDGAPLELNAKSGVVTVVYFFLMDNWNYDVQILNKMARLAGPEKLQVVGVSGDGLRPRVEAFAARYKLNFPIYFDESGMRNPAAQKFGVKGWPAAFIFGADGKLQFIGNRLGAVDFQKKVREILPVIGRNDFILQDDEVINPE